MKTTDKPVNKWTYKDFTWVLSLFGTAVGAGVLFLPIKAGSGGFWPLVILALIATPMIWLAHKGLARFVLSAKNPNSDITDTVEEHFGKTGANIITFAYFFAIYPIVLIYGVGITNTVDSFFSSPVTHGADATLATVWDINWCDDGGCVVWA
ncbi:aromatic amino acid transport family protein [Providencia stuartii]|nr:aromatic amino acid transport family protein [Providencia stuartii]